MTDRPWSSELLAPDGTSIRENFARWFGDSKVVDHRGEPLVVHHGSKRSFDAFDPRHFGRTDEGLFGHGFYFSDCQAYAGGYGPTRPFFLALERPVLVGAEDNDPMYRLLRDIAEEDGPDAVREWMECEGHDGIIARSQGRTVEFVVYDPGRIKSAHANSGLYRRDSASLSDGAAAPSAVTAPRRPAR